MIATSNAKINSETFKFIKFSSVDLPIHIKSNSVDLPIYMKYSSVDLSSYIKYSRIDLPIYIKYSSIDLPITNETADNRIFLACILLSQTR